MSKILSVLPVNGSQKELLETAAAEAGVPIVCVPDGAVSAETVFSADCIIGNADPELLRRHKGLRWLQTNSAGTDQYTVPGVLPAGCLLTNATGAYSPSVGEHMLAVTLMLMKNLHRYRDNQQASLWQDEGGVTSLAGSSVLIFGAGDIGLHYAKLVKLLGARAIGVKRRPGNKSEWLDGLYLTQESDALIPAADVIVSVLPGTPETAGFFDARRFSLMKKTALFINAGRGSAVNQKALADALENGIIAGASLDVSDPEPLPKDSPLWKIKNLVLTPHVSGGFHLPVTMDRIVAIACENIKRFFSGSAETVPLLNEVDIATGYKK